MNEGLLYDDKDMLGAHWREDEKPILCTSYDDRVNSGAPLAADPSVFKDKNGDIWMVLGNYWNGLHVVAIDQTTGKIKGSKATDPYNSWSVDKDLFTFIAKGPDVKDDARHSKGGAIGDASIYYNSEAQLYYLFATWKSPYGKS